ncbi:MAG: hypothetical protein LBL96_04330 [Clostridiales bacterium]|jgi:hypothetical protein|nr:hypothetical protein [Clostridiales bacterium]
MDFSIYKRTGGDSFSNAYVGANQEGKAIMMTEYYTRGIMSHRYNSITSETRLKFFRGLWVVKSLNLPNIPDIIDVCQDGECPGFHAEDNMPGGIYATWDAFFGVSVRDHICNGGAMPHPQAALDVLTPLVEDLETASQSGLYFLVAPDNLCITDHGQIKLNAMVTPAADAKAMIKGLANSFYFMVEGYPFGNALPVVNPNGEKAGQFTLTLPPEIVERIEKIMSGAIVFDSIAESLEYLKSCVRTYVKPSFAKAPVYMVAQKHGYDAPYSRRQLRKLSMAVAGLFLLATLTLFAAFFFSEYPNRNEQVQAVSIIAE